MNISLSDATAIVDRATSHADAMGVPMNIAVVATCAIRWSTSSLGSTNALPRRY